MALVSKILVPVEFSPRCLGSAQFAETLAAHFHAEIVLLHVVPSQFPAYIAPDVTAYANIADLSTGLLLEAEARLEAFPGQGREFDGHVLRKVCEGDPARTIVEVAGEGGFDLIVMPTHGYGPFRRFLLGSVTAKVLHDAACPVWTGPHMESAPSDQPLKLSRIVCAVNLEAESRDVLGWSRCLAQEFDSELHIVHAISASERRAGGWSFDPDWRADVARRARASIDELQSLLHSFGEVTIEIGEPADAVCQTACGIDADLVVIGRGRGGLLGRLRRHAYAIVKESPCPVLAV
jgi:nucleotide-binding universal stress UspA family protein